MSEKRREKKRDAVRSFQRYYVRPSKRLADSSVAYALHTVLYADCVDREKDDVLRNAGSNTGQHVMAEGQARRVPDLPVVFVVHCE